MDDIKLPVPSRSRTMPTRTSSTDNINSQAFAGRVGANQQFAIPSTEFLGNEPADARQDATWKEILDLRGFRDTVLWKNALIEGVGLCFQVFIAGIVAAGLDNYTDGPPLSVTIAALIQFIVITLFILAAGPVTGAHFNPLITMATFMAKLTSLPRAILYVVAQCIGSIIGAFLLRAALGISAEGLEKSPGCYIDPMLVTPGSAFALETVTSSFLLFLAFGLGLDPRNAGELPRALGPFLIGATAATTLFAGGMARRGHLGSANNPARCLGLMAASGRFTYHYVHWAGDITASIICATLYRVVPPYK